jgi:hypothetical protein
MNKILLVLLFSFAAHAQTGADAIGLGILYAASAVFGVQYSNALPKDQIKGTCKFEGSSCMGAVLTLKDHNGKALESQTITSTSGFLFGNLKETEYELEITYTRYKLKPTTQKVKPGSEVNIQLKKT